MPVYIGREPNWRRLEESPYYWWWMYLKLNRAYINTCQNSGDGACAELYEHFGDIRADGDEAFLDWWGPDGENHGRLFQERTLMPEARMISSQADWTPEMGRYPYVVIAVDLHLGLREATKMINRVLPRHFLKREGKTPMPLRFSTARYKLSDYGQPEKFENCYRVYTAFREAVDRYGEIGHIPPREFLQISRTLSIDDNQDLVQLYEKASGWVGWVGQGSFPGPPLAEFREWERTLNHIIEDSGLPLQYME
jgi:hypothetical protein